MSFLQIVGRIGWGGLKAALLGAFICGLFNALFGPLAYVFYSVFTNWACGNPPWKDVLQLYSAIFPLNAIMGAVWGGCAGFLSWLPIGWNRSIRQKEFPVSRLAKTAFIGGCLTAIFYFVDLMLLFYYLAKSSSSGTGLMLTGFLGTAGVPYLVGGIPIQFLIYIWPIYAFALGLMLGSWWGARTPKSKPERGSE